MTARNNKIILAPVEDNKNCTYEIKVVWNMEFCEVLNKIKFYLILYPFRDNLNASNKSS
jgi:hypothetical protein